MNVSVAMGKKNAGIGRIRQQNSLSLGVEEWGGIINEINDHGGGKGMSGSNIGSSRRGLHRRSTSMVNRGPNKSLNKGSEFSFRTVFGVGSSNNNNNNIKQQFAIAAGSKLK